jgi:hypothetical protein
MTHDLARDDIPLALLMRRDVDGDALLAPLLRAVAMTSRWETGLKIVFSALILLNSAAAVACAGPLLHIPPPARWPTSATLFLLQLPLLGLSLMLASTRAAKEGFPPRYRQFVGSIPTATVAKASGAGFVLIEGFFQAVEQRRAVYDGHSIDYELVQSRDIEGRRLDLPLVRWRNSQYVHFRFPWPVAWPEEKTLRALRPGAPIVLVARVVSGHEAGYREPPPGLSEQRSFGMVDWLLFPVATRDKALRMMLFNESHTAAYAAATLLLLSLLAVVLCLAVRLVGH